MSEDKPWITEDMLEQMESLHKSQEDFIKHYFGDWYIDQRTIDLQDAIYKFYNEHQDSCNKLYSVSWKALLDKLQFNGYSREDIREARKVVRGWRLKGDNYSKSL